ncbi:MAG: acyltransferase [Verrucomicrobiales bacterium]|nr:acyltransferase [Verrucomicrobiales bacterium]
MNREGSWPKRLFSLHISRGIAALAVVVWHWEHFADSSYARPENLDKSAYPFHSFLKVFHEKGYFGVSYFFLLSGFIFFWLYRQRIEERTVGFGNFWLQRFSRLYPLHFVTLLLVAGLQFLFSSTNPSGEFFIYPSNDAPHFLLQLGFASHWGLESTKSFNGPIWSVSVEILLYLVFFVVALLGKGRFFSCALIALVGMVLYPATKHMFFLGLSLFFLGGVVYEVTGWLFQRRAFQHRLLYLATGVSSMAWLATIFVPGIEDSIASLSLLELNRGEGILPRFSWIGDITYSPYLLHFPLQLVLMIAVTNSFLRPDFYLSPLWLLLFLTVLVASSYATFRYFEVPMQRRIRNLAKSPPGKPIRGAVAGSGILR